MLKFSAYRQTEQDKQTEQKLYAPDLFMWGHKKQKCNNCHDIN